MRQAPPTRKKAHRSTMENPRGQPCSSHPMLKNCHQYHCPSLLLFSSMPFTKAMNSSECTTGFWRNREIVGQSTSRHESRVITYIHLSYRATYLGGGWPSKLLWTLSASKRLMIRLTVMMRFFGSISGEPVLAACANDGPWYTVSNFPQSSLQMSGKHQSIPSNHYC